MAVAALNGHFGLVGGKFVYMEGSDDIAERLYHESIERQADLEEYHIEVKRALVDKRIISTHEADEITNSLLSLKTFGDLLGFLQKTPFALSATARANVESFIERNLAILGAGYPLDQDAIQSFIEILLDEREVLRRIGEGGEGVVYRSSRSPTPISDKDEGVAESPLARDVSIRYAHTAAIKLLLSGDYTQGNPEVIASLRRSPGVLSVSCVREIISPQSQAPQVGLVMEMGRKSAKAALYDEPTINGKLMLLLQIALKVADFHRSHMVHMDLKFQNALVMRDGRVELIDASFARRVGDEAPKRPMTLVYSSPPESINVLVTQQNMIVEAFFDLWSLGIMQYEILMDGVPDLGNGMAFVFAVMQGSYAAKMFPEKSLPALHADLSECVEELLEETKQPNLNVALDLLLEKDHLEKFIADYEARKEQLINLLTMPYDQMNLDAILESKRFLDSLPGGFLSEYSSILSKMQKTIATIHIKMQMEAYPELIEINRRLLSFDGAQRGDINQYVAELSKYLVEHR